MSDPKLVDCPACQAPALKKQVTAAAFKLKGTGWYETDFKNSGKKPDAATTKSSQTSSDSAAADKKSDSSTPGSDQAKAASGAAE